MTPTDVYAMSNSEFKGFEDFMVMWLREQARQQRQAQRKRGG